MLMFLGMTVPPVDDVRFIDSTGGVRAPRPATPSLLELRHVPDHPTQDRRTDTVSPRSAIIEARGGALNAHAAGSEPSLFRLVRGAAS